MLLLQLIVDGAIAGCAIGVVAITFTYVYSTTGVFHIAHAGIYTLGSYIAWFATQKGLPFVVGLALASLVCMAAGALIQKGIYEPLMRRKASALVLLIASLGVLAVLQNVVAILFTPNILQFNTAWRLATVTVGPLELSYPQILTAVASVAILVGLMLFSSRTLLGGRIRAVASNPQLAELVRLRPHQVYVYVLGLSSALVSVAGVLVGLDQAIQPYTSVLILLSAVIAVIAGGIGSLPGAFIVAVALSVLQSLVLAWVPGRWSIALTFALFIVFILTRPTGLFRTRLQRAS